MRPKTRTIAGGLIVVGIVVGSFLGGLIPGFGSGSGTGIRTAASNAGTETVSLETDASEVVVSPGDEPAQPVEKAPPEILTVRVHGHDYLIPADTADGVRQADLDEIVELAQTTTGNEDGVRVRILRTRSARLVAWSNLYDSLEKAGLKRDSITMPKELTEYGLGY